jgi:formate hydrogenlyase transcriptional activator
MEKVEPIHVQPNSVTTMGSAAAGSFSGCIMPVMASSEQGSERLNAQLLVDSIPALIHTARPDGYLDYFNKPWLEYLAVTLDKVAGWNWTAYVHPEDVEGIVAKWRACLATGEIFEYETRVRRANGEYRWMFHRKVPLRDAHGNIVKWYGSSLDIEERKAAEEKIREQETELRKMLDLTPQHVFVYEPDGSPIYANQGALEYFGVEADQLLAESRINFVHPDDREHFLAERKKELLTGAPHEFEARLLRHDGTFRWFLFRRNPLKDERGQILRWYGTATEIEDRKRAEEALRTSEAYLAEAQRLSQTGSWAWTPANDNRYYSEECYRVLGFDPHGPPPPLETVIQRIHPDDQADCRERVAKAFDHKVDFELEYRIIHPDKRVRDIHCIGHTVLDRSGDLVELVGTVIDITDRKRAEQALRRSEAYLAEAQRLSHTGSLGWKVSSGEIFWSDETFRIFECDRKIKPTVEFVLSRVHPEDRDLVQQQIDRASRDGAGFDFEHRLQLPDGSVKHVRVTAHPSRDSAGNFEFVGAVTDVSEQRHAEAVIREQEAELREVVDTIPAIVWSARPDGSNSYVNSRFVEYCGMAPEQIAGAGWQAATRPDGLERHKAKWLACVASGEPFEDEVGFRRADGQYRWHLQRGIPLRDEAGNIVKWYGVLTDIEDRKRAEEKIREQERELRQMLDLTPQHVHVLAADATLVYTNEVALKYHGLTLDEWKERPFTEWRADEVPFTVFHPDDREGLMGELRNKFLSGSPHETEARLLRDDGKYRWFLFRFNPLRDRQGCVMRWYVAGTDIEDRKRAEEKLQQENVALREEIDKASMFEEIVGTSPVLKSVLSRISKVAPSDSTVLITGDTGTGKELVARAIHRRSDRASRAFVSVNCAAIPRDLIASELFGHEKGAFTGATQQRPGRFELANGGTLFLDEVGELPVETQIALLRVLQEHEFERVGGTRRIRADVRVIAATNRDLQAAISAGSFRSDLFYRLHVFPIEIPSLRERRADIPLLVEYFIDRYARKAGKNIKRVNRKTLELLQLYPWPGNIRELQNVIERSVILCETEIFSIDENWLPQPPPLTPESKQQVELPRRLLVQEKDMIEAALKDTRGRVSGPTGAAVKLGIPRSTLESKIRSLKIDKNRFRPDSGN